MRAHDPSGFAFAQDAFPEARNKSDIEMAGFLLDRSGNKRF